MTQTKATPVITPLQAQELLQRALQLLEAPCPSLQQQHSWIKHHMALDYRHEPCEPQSDNAVAYCELGAMKAVSHYLDQDQVNGPTYRYIQSLFNMANPNVIANDTIPSVNDNPQTEFELVRRMFQKAIRACDRFIKS